MTHIVEEGRFSHEKSEIVGTRSPEQAYEDFVRFLEGYELMMSMNSADNEAIEAQLPEGARLNTVICEAMDGLEIIRICTMTEEEVEEEIGEEHEECGPLFTAESPDGEVTEVWGTEPDRFTWSPCTECTEANN